MPAVVRDGLRLMLGASTCSWASHAGGKRAVTLAITVASPGSARRGNPVLEATTGVENSWVEDSGVLTALLNAFALILVLNLRKMICNNILCFLFFGLKQSSFAITSTLFCQNACCSAQVSQRQYVAPCLSELLLMTFWFVSFNILSISLYFQR